MVGAALWILAMLGVDKTDAAVVDALAWFNANYTWTWTAGYASGNRHAFYYATYGMAKGLTGLLGSTGRVGDPTTGHLWVQDFKNSMVASKTSGGSYYWYTGEYLDPGTIISTSFVLMSLAFADPTTESTQKFLPDEVGTDVLVPNKGLVTLETTGGVTLSSAKRGNIGQAVKPPKYELPIGAFDFKLNKVPKNGTTVLTIHVPAGALDPANPNAFINADGSLKAGLNWFKIQGGSWKGMASVPIELDPVAKVIRVTLRNGGPEDQDGTGENTSIDDPGAPGVGADTEAEEASSNANCFIATAAYGSSMADDVLALRLFRDRHLLTNPLGRAFVTFYYAVSPPIAGFIAKHESLRALTRISLMPVVAGVKHPGAAILLFGGFFVAGAGTVVYRRRKEH